MKPSSQWIIATVCLCAFAAHAQAQDEQKCLGVAKFAEAAANLMHLGQSEDQVIAAMLAHQTGNSQRPKARQKLLDDRDVAIVNWVYTIKPASSDARALIYMKCIAHGLGWIDPAEYKAAGATSKSK